MSSRFLKGAMILSLSIFVTRLLGVLYVVPFQRMVGPGGMALYGYAYVPYQLLVTLSTLGIPLGISKFISKYNADNEYDTSRKIFSVGMLVMVVVGVIGFLIMWFGAPFMADMAMAGQVDVHNTRADTIMAIRMVSFAVIIVPPMSIFRGFFQGNQDMVPTAVSQFVEQLVRVILIIVSSFLVIKVFNGTAQTAVKISVFAAFVAAVSSMIILYYYWRKKKHGFDALLALSRPHPKRQTKKLFTELLAYALPFAILSLTPTWFQMIDTMTFNAGMIAAGVEPALAEGLFGIYITSLFKIVMIPVSFSIAFGQPLIPEITEKIRIRNFTGVHKTLTSAILLTSFITIPAVIGMSMLSNPLFVLLFNAGPEMNELGGAMFATGSFIALFMGLNGIVSSIIQGVDRQFKSLIFLLITSVIKLVANLVFIPLFSFHGAILSTILAYAFFLLMNFWEIRKTTGIQTRVILKRHISILVFTGFMAVSVWLTTSFLDLFLDYTTSSVVAGLYIVIAGTVGALVYAGFAIYFDLAKMLFGKKLSFDGIKARLSRNA